MKEHNITLLNHPYDKIFNEKYVINELGYYIKEIKYNKNLLKDISGSILPQYIDNDNKRLKKLFRKILIIKKRYEQKQILINFNKWFININTPEKNNKSRNKKENIDKSINSISNNNKILKALNLKLKFKKNIHKTCSFSYKNSDNKKSKTNSILMNKTSPNFFNDSQLSSITVKKSKKNSNSQSIKQNIIKNNINKSYSMPRKNEILSLNVITKNKKNKTPNKNKEMINEFMNNLNMSKKNKEEKMKNLNKKIEEKMNSIYTFSPKIIGNKNNEKYLKNMVEKLYDNTMKDNINNLSKYNNENFNENDNQLDIVLEEDRNNKDINFISRLNIYEEKRKNNLEKIKNDILIEEYLNKNMRNYNNNNDKYDIGEDHLLNSSNSYFHNKKRLIDKITKEIKEEKGITFEPNLNNDYNNRVKNNFQNLKEDLNNKKKEKIYDYLTYRDKECTFQPKINNINNFYFFNNSANVGQRLLSYQDKYNQKLIELKKKNPKYSFKPKISKNTHIILNKKNQLLINNTKEQIKRNISLKNNKPKFEEKKDSLKMNESQKNYENNKESFTPIFDNSKNEYNNKIDYNDYNDFKFCESLEYSEDIIEEKKYPNMEFKTSLIQNKNKNEKKPEKNNNNKNIMIFDYYDKLI